MGLANITNAVLGDTSSGEPLKDVWATLAEAKVAFRRGTSVVIGGAPAVGKSAFALNLVIKSGARTVYFSADSGPMTQKARIVSILTGREVQEVLDAMDADRSAFDDVVRQVSNIWWEFETSPTLDDIEESLKAYSYLGAFPELVVIDNLLNVDLEDAAGQDWQNVELVLLFAQDLAAKTGACVVVLAHLTGEYEDGDTPPPKSALRGKGAKIPVLILNLFRQGQDMGVVIAKHRNGPDDPTAERPMTLRMDLSRMAIEDYPPSFNTFAA